MSDTVLDRLVQALAANNDPNVQADPVAVLWPDKARQWAKAISLVREQRPVFTLGEHDPDTLTGPAYWVRCAVAETVEVEGPGGLPIVYLPGVSREDLRGVMADNQELAPLAGLQHRSQWFAHENGKDWTVAAFLMNRTRGLGLQVGTDSATGDALVAAADHVLREPMSRVEETFVDAAFVNNLLSPDLVDALLRWIDDPAAARRATAAATWNAFVAQCKSVYRFDPASAGEVEAARRLGTAHTAAWGQAWSRFEKHPADYPNIPKRLRAAQPDDLFAAQSLAWPQVNEAAEEMLRARLLDMPNATPSGARADITRFESEHGARRGSVWSRLGHAPLAMALEHLAEVGRLTATTPIAGDVAQIASAYASGGWRIDLAALRALGELDSPKDVEAVGAALDALYRGWLDQAAKALQAAVGPFALATTYAATPAPSPAAGEVVVFVDGLRLDLAHLLHDHLTEIRGLTVGLATTLAALPTVTHTAKPVLVPIDQAALAAGNELDACRAPGGASAGVQVLRSLLGNAGVQVLEGQQTGDASGRAWTEAGNLDHKGHDLGVAFAREVDAEIGALARRIRDLLAAGWKKVTVVTDHGWLMLPSGLPKNESLPVAATVKKKGRCARLKDGAQTDLPTVPWHWNTDVRIAIAPGISCFEANQVYEHGGVSPQECVVPRLTVTTSGALPQSDGLPEITNIKWRGLALTVEFADLPEGAKVDLRRQAGDPATSIAERAHVTGVVGRLVLMVGDDDADGQPAQLVIVGTDGGVLVQRSTTVGKNG